MSKMLWELKVPFYVGTMKEDLGKNNIWKYLRYFRMFMERFKLKVNEKDISYSYFSKILFGGYVGIINDPLLGACVGSVDIESVDADGNPKIVTFNYDNGKKRKCEVGKDIVIAYSDGTKIPPVLYLWAIANKVITREDIIDQQDNMLRKPIVVAGEGEDFDNAVNNAENLLSGIAWLNTKAKKQSKAKGNILQSKDMEVLNLQVGNAYKGAELWDSRKNYEELICDYLGYTTTKNEKKERMNTLEVKNENSIGQTFYDSSKFHLLLMKKDCERVLNITVDIEYLLERKEEGGEDNGSGKENMGRASTKEQQND